LPPHAALRPQADAVDTRRVDVDVDVDIDAVNAGSRRPSHRHPSQVSHRFCEPQRGATSTQVKSTLKQVKYEIAQRQLHADPGVFIGIFIGLLVSIFISIFISIFVGIGIEIASLKGSR